MVARVATEPIRNKLLDGDGGDFPTDDGSQHGAEEQELDFKHTRTTNDRGQNHDRPSLNLRSEDKRWDDAKDCDHYGNHDS
jgi:hypothetical protein